MLSSELSMSDFLSSELEVWSCAFVEVSLLIRDHMKCLDTTSSPCYWIGGMIYHNYITHHNETKRNITQRKRKRRSTVEGSSRNRTAGEPARAIARDNLRLVPNVVGRMRKQTKQKQEWDFEKQCQRMEKRTSKQIEPPLYIPQGLSALRAKEIYWMRYSVVLFAARSDIPRSRDIM